MPNIVILQVGGYEFELLEERVWLPIDAPIHHPPFLQALAMAQMLRPIAYGLDAMWIHGGRYSAMWEQMDSITLYQIVKLYGIASSRPDIIFPKGTAALIKYAKQEIERRESFKQKQQDDKPASPGIVYLLHAGEYYKIGLTRSDVYQRVEQIQRTMPYPIEVIHTIDTSTPERLEADLHSTYVNKRVAGEWFALSDDDVEHIKSLGGAA